MAGILLSLRYVRCFLLSLVHRSLTLNPPAVSRLLFLLLFLVSGVRVLAQPAPPLRRDSLLLVLKEARSDTARMRANQVLSKFYWSRSVDSVLLYGNAALALARKLHLETAEAEALNSIGSGCRQAARYEEAIRYYEQALAIFTRLGEEENISACLSNLGSTYRDLGNYPRAIEMLNEGIRRKEQRGHRNKLSSSYLNLGLVYKRQGNYALALDAYGKSLALSQEFHNYETYVHALTNIGNVYGKLGRHTDALSYHQRSLEASIRLDDRNSISNCYNNIGLVYKNLHDYARAQDMYAQALPLKKRLGRIRDVISIQGNIAEVYFLQKSYARSVEASRLALRLADSLDQAAMVCEVLPVLVQALVAQQKAADALPFARRLHTVAHQLQSKADMLEADLRLAEVYRALHQDALVYPLMEEATKLKDSLFNAELTMQMQAAQQQYELVQKERENEALRKRNDRNMVILTRQRFIGIGILLLMGVLGMVGIFIYRQSRERKRLNGLLMEANGALQHKNAELAQLNGIKAKLLSVISHDIRSPLNSLRGMLMLVDLGHISAQEFKQDFLARINESVDRTLEFADNLLFWAKNQMEGMTATPEVFGVGTLVADVLALYGPQAEKKGIALAATVDAALAAYADPEMIRTVLRNLLSNALKFTPPQGSVTLTATPGEALITLRVQDTGVGMNAETLAQLFTADQKSTPGTADERGAGVGLILCRDFVERNGGTLWVESEPGKGSTFCFTLPLETTGMIDGKN